MKKFLVLILALAVAVPGIAHASKIKTTQVLWRSNAAANPAPGYVDSSYFSQASAISDTTAPISLQDLNWNDGGGAAADSLSFITFHLVPRPSSAVTVASDSCYITVQVSADGNTWVSLTTAPTLNALELGTTNSFTITLGQNVGAGGNAALRNTVNQWSAIRFINQASDMTGQWQGYVRYPRSE